MANKNKTLIIGLVICVLMLAVITGLLITKLTENKAPSKPAKTAPIMKNNIQEQGVSKLEIYNPIINPSDFTTKITNPYFSLPVGKKIVYEAKTEDGTEKIEILIPGWTKKIMGVETLVFWDRVYLDGELIEDTRDYIAQDKEGNVWYFGENVDNYVGGKLMDHGGAWIGGIDGAKPGIWMKANPKIGDEYRQEYYKGKAEDMARVDGVGFKVTVPAGSFTDCVKIFEWTPLESATAYKYHCAGAGTVLEEEDNEQVKLIEVDNTGAKCIKLTETYMKEGVLPGATSQCTNLINSEIKENAEELKTEITEEEAKKIALNKVPGKVTDVAIEKKFGKAAYVVEIDADSGPETDVIIDIETGEVLGVET